MAGQTEPAAGGGSGRPAGCGGGSAAAPGPLSRPLGASFHTSPPPAPSVRSREYPPPPSPHLLLPRRPLASSRPLAEPEPIPGARAHHWPRLDGAPLAWGAERRDRGPKPGFRCPEARLTGQCGHRRAWPARSDGAAEEAQGSEGLGHRGRGLAPKNGCRTETRRGGGGLRPAGRRREAWGPWSAGEAGRASGEGNNNEMDRWHASGNPGLTASPGLSYLFNRRPPPALLRSRGLTRRVVSEPRVAGEGSMSPQPRPSRPQGTGEAGLALRQIRAARGPPGLPAGPWGHQSGGNCGDCGALSPNCRARGSGSPAPRGASSPKPRLQAPESLSFSLPHLRPASGTRP